MKEFVFIWFKRFPCNLESIHQDSIFAVSRKKASKKLDKLFSYAFVLRELK